MIRRLSILGLIVLFAFSLISVRTTTRLLEKQLAHVEAAIAAEEEKAALARIELAYLSRPERIRVLAERFLHLKQANYGQISFEFSGNKPSLTPVAHAPKPILVGWRYKHTAKKYVKAASNKERASK